MPRRCSSSTQSARPSLTQLNGRDSARLPASKKISLENIPAFELLAGALSESPHLDKYIRLLEIHDIPANCAPSAMVLSSTGARRHHLSRRENPALMEFLSLGSLRCVAIADVKETPLSIVTMLLAACEVFLLGIDITLDGGATESTAPISHPMRHLLSLLRV
ncbi:hypothetical protein MSAN_00493300 [Mycena sanguinolenta]|uniref:Uncharacterized protein n=1 Tax=Mycena sanguinolenta TaxID=230812 RepID=A0A8H6Z8I5_9AGAR|nr:hypothetical protein MSAN_00493300 [Mycena sanguinolenta]